MHIATRSDETDGLELCDREYHSPNVAVADVETADATLWSEFKPKYLEIEGSTASSYAKHVMDSVQGE